jgi:hypothetical protein
MAASGHLRKWPRQIGFDKIGTGKGVANGLAMWRPIAKTIAATTIGVMLLSGRRRRGRAGGAAYRVGVVEQSGGVGRLAGKFAGALRKWRIRTSTHRCRTATDRYCPGRGRAWASICSSSHRRGVRYARRPSLLQMDWGSPGCWHDIFGPCDAVASSLLRPTPAPPGDPHARAISRTSELDFATGRHAFAAVAQRGTWRHGFSGRWRGRC